MSSPFVDVTLTVNGKTYTRKVPSTLPLVDFLHEELSLTGTKFTCGVGVCRACTVAACRVPKAHAVPTLACSTPVGELNGQTITTVEGLAGPSGPSPLQQTFLDEFAFQCGYCTPGFLMATNMLMDRLREKPIPEDQLEAAIQDAVGSHICRCTGYARYHAAIRKVILGTPGLTVR